jgi:hypothetical protein
MDAEPSVSRGGSTATRVTYDGAKTGLAAHRCRFHSHERAKTREGAPKSTAGAAPSAIGDPMRGGVGGNQGSPASAWVCAQRRWVGDGQTRVRDRALETATHASERRTRKKFDTARLRWHRVYWRVGECARGALREEGLRSNHSLSSQKHRCFGETNDVCGVCNTAKMMARSRCEKMESVKHMNHEDGCGDDGGRRERGRGEGGGVEQRLVFGCVRRLAYLSRMQGAMNRTIEGRQHGLASELHC